MSEELSPPASPAPAPAGPGSQIPGSEKKLVAGLLGVLYLTKSDQEFVDTYVNGRKGWF